MKTKIIFVGILILALTSTVFSQNCGDKTCLAAQFCQDVDEDDGSGGNGICGSCPTDTYREAPEGQLDNESGDDTTVCQICGAGQEPNTQRSGCQACGDGAASSASEKTCSDCGAGQEPNVGKSECVPCGDGKYSEAADTSCKLCPEGEEPNTNQDDCVACGTGAYRAATANTGCQQCGAGTIPNTQKSDCDPCGDGQASAGGVASCETCGTGKIPNSAKSACIACDAGKISASGANTCGSCPDNFHGYIESQAAACYESCDTDDAVDHKKCATDYYCVKEGTEFTCEECPDDGTRAQTSEDGCVAAESTSSGSVLSFSLMIITLLGTLLF